MKLLNIRKKEAENKFLDNLITNNGSNSFYRYVKRRRRGEREIETIEGALGNIITDRSEIVDEFRKYFASTYKAPN